MGRLTALSQSKGSPREGEGNFPLLHFLLPPGEENRGKGLNRERKIKERVFHRVAALTG
ncbi:MAG TPA: hypothetical protein VFG28_08380 [Syntrophales bacterium]|nr:hypothetical protein [Syntrophales bacterium]